eukprot:TRINITY_DN1168_c0_g1_i1.p1 TRINITY_DN1168_c0_g1~~TRINITY_DN1168_c0_g1_i1.p1  ORF type:complete len:416 (-),score=97.09 TRINITY_DN1168_c0_g1_i1:151-1398(-)
MNLKLMKLKFLGGEAFKKACFEYIKAFLIKGVPSLFSSLKIFYKTSSKVEILQKLIDENLQSLKEKQTFEGEEELQDPTIYLWMLMFAAQHYKIIGNLEKALELINEAITHTSTLPELYVIKARILKHLNKPDEAWRTLNEGRELDLADRYMNARTVKYMIRAYSTHVPLKEDEKEKEKEKEKEEKKEEKEDEEDTWQKREEKERKEEEKRDLLERAEDVMTLFSRDHREGQLNVHIMQCMWYEIEMAKAHFLKDQIPKSMQMFKYVYRHFHNIFNDQYNYHGYALRRGNFLAYLDMIEATEKHYQNNYFAEACLGMIKCLRLYSKDEKKYIEMQKTLKMSTKKKDDKEEDDPDAKLGDIDFYDIQTEKIPINKLFPWQLRDSSIIQNSKNFILKQWICSLNQKNGGKRSDQQFS